MLAAHSHPAAEVIANEEIELPVVSGHGWRYEAAAEHDARHIECRRNVVQRALMRNYGPRLSYDRSRLPDGRHHELGTLERLGSRRSELRVVNAVTS